MCLKKQDARCEKLNRTPRPPVGATSPTQFLCLSKNAAPGLMLATPGTRVRSYTAPSSSAVSSRTPGVQSRKTGRPASCDRCDKHRISLISPETKPTQSTHTQPNPSMNPQPTRSSKSPSVRTSSTDSSCRCHASPHLAMRGYRTLR